MVRLTHLRATGYGNVLWAIIAPWFLYSLYMCMYPVTLKGELIHSLGHLGQQNTLKTQH